VAVAGMRDGRSASSIRDAPSISESSGVQFGLWSWVFPETMHLSQIPCLRLLALDTRLGFDRFFSRVRCGSKLVQIGGPQVAVGVHDSWRLADIGVVDDASLIAANECADYVGRERLRRPDGPLSARSCRFGESILSDTFLGSPSAQPALVIALSERHTPRAQDVVCGDGVEIEVGQRKRKDEGLRREG
jgi:hypothetical protein